MGVRHRADTLAALLLRGVVWRSGVRTNDSGAPPSPKLPAPDAPDIAPRQTAYCTGHPGRGPAGLVWGAPQRNQDPPFPQQLHYYAGQTAAWANQRGGFRSPFCCDFAKGAEASVDLFLALSPLCFWCFVPPNSAPKCPGRSPTPT
ncbi:uncharacterized protein Triagg1_6260 [Trichoderma aggressivum f. europaeum]|uniref:Uncharacterized protein n=1 Tax=Trichoderma aggressivum f. europaeum TaxID=173218 RepID=A0AAE1LXT9_9HYPO|nr:hypothetical protein Triagg1_6260 [Trichoderma aggressivum f. europaeum]